MPLDAANFIAELDIDSPPGTDPLNQGDDQIRTAKRTQLNSFPLVGGAVNITHDQMNQMAIKNEANTFTQQQQFANNILLDSGGNNSIFFDNTGVRVWQLLHVGGSAQLELRRFVGGALIDAPMQINNAFGEFTFLADASFGRTLLAADGVAGAPAYRFTNSTNMGMYRIANGILGLSPNGTEQFRMTSVFSQFAGVLHAPDGTTAAPGYAFTSDLGTGITASATSLNISANGQSIASFTSSSDIFAADGRSWAGNSLRTVSRPAFNFNSDSDTGFYNPAANTIGIGVGGAAWGTMDAFALWLADGVSVHGDAAGDAADPAFAFTNDTDSGLFRAAADSVSIAAGAESVLNFDKGTKAMWSGAGYHFRMDGTADAGTPVYSFSNDTDTGMYRRAANALGFASAGAEIFNIGSGGIGVISGKLCFFNLPTSAGTSGSLWNSGGVVRVA